MTDIFTQALALTEQAVKDQVATSDTPRTQAEFDRIREGLLDHKWSLTDAFNGMRDWSVKLERELAAAQRDAERSRELLRRMLTLRSDAPGFFAAFSKLCLDTDAAIDAAKEGK